MTIQVIAATGALPDSPARVDPPTRKPFRIGAVQHRWHPDAAEHEHALAEGVRAAAGEGAQLVCLQELTLSPYFAVAADGPRDAAEAIPDGPTCRFAAALAQETGVHVHASLYERNPDDPDGLGFNTAVVLAPDGSSGPRSSPR
jgi:N-carbamoylputrescine amidase